MLDALLLAIELLPVITSSKHWLNPQFEPLQVLIAKRFWINSDGIINLTCSEHKHDPSQFTRLKRPTRKRRLATAAFFHPSLFSPLYIAHPLGNFSINHFARIQLEHDHIGIHYVWRKFHLQELRDHTDKDGTASRANSMPPSVSLRSTPMASCLP